MAFMVFLLFYVMSLMIINDLDVIWAIFPPLEANTPLPVYADALPVQTVSAQRFKSIARKIHKVFDTGGAVKYLQSPFSLLRNGLKTWYPLTKIQFFSMLAGK